MVGVHPKAHNSCCSRPGHHGGRLEVETEFRCRVVAPKRQHDRCVPVVVDRQLMTPDSTAMRDLGDQLGAQLDEAANRDRAFLDGRILLADRGRNPHAEYHASSRDRRGARWLERHGHRALFAGKERERRRCHDGPRRRGTHHLDEVLVHHRPDIADCERRDSLFTGFDMQRARGEHSAKGHNGASLHRESGRFPRASTVAADAGRHPCGDCAHRRFATLTFTRQLRSGSPAGAHGVSQRNGLRPGRRVDSRVDMLDVVPRRLRRGEQLPR